MTKTKWVLDPTHSDLTFKIRHLMISNLSGSFKNFHVELDTDGTKFETGEIKGTAEVASIFTNNDQRDAHLRTSDFFEADKYPELGFQSTRLKKIDNENFDLHGNLTMKGITKPVQLKVEFNGVTKDPWGGERAGFLITGKINRSDWGLNFNSLLETGGVALSEEVRITSEIQLVKQAISVAA